MLCLLNERTKHRTGSRTSLPQILELKMDPTLPVGPDSRQWLAARVGPSGYRADISTRGHALIAPRRRSCHLLLKAAVHSSP